MSLMAKQYVERLESISSDVESWGGKAVVLGKLLKYALPIPKGIVLHTYWYKEYKNIRDCGMELVRFKKNLNNIIGNYLEDHETGQIYIFRSSANIEGNDELCCSGIFESYLCDKGMEYADAAIQVWESIYDTNTIKYLSSSISMSELKMGILIQPICRGEFSGVMQTCDVVQGSAEVVIEYCSWRLEAVVDGTDNSDRIVLSEIGEVKSGFWKGDCSVLEKLYGMGKKIESILGSAVEIEFITSEDNVYILQARRLREWC